MVGLKGLGNTETELVKATKFSNDVVPVKTSKQLIKGLLQIFNISQLDKTTLESALNSDFEDYEDSVLHESALRTGVNGIVTRNRKDFSSSKLTIFDPEELLKIIHSSK